MVFGGGRKAKVENREWKAGLRGEYLQDAREWECDEQEEEYGNAKDLEKSDPRSDPQRTRVGHP